MFFAFALAVAVPELVWGIKRATLKFLKKWIKIKTKKKNKWIQIKITKP